MVVSLGVMRPTVIQLVKLTSQPPQMPVGVLSTGVGAGGPPPGPPSAVLVLVNRQRLMGMVLSILILLIVLLMAFQPGGAGA